MMMHFVLGTIPLTRVSQIPLKIFIKIRFCYPCDGADLLAATFGGLTLRMLIVIAIPVSCWLRGLGPLEFAGTNFFEKPCGLGKAIKV